MNGDGLIDREQSPSLGGPRTLLLVLAIVNCAFAIIVEILGSFSISVVYAGALGRYRLLESEGVINQDRLLQTLGSPRAESWTGVVNWLVGDAVQELGSAVHIVSGLFLLSALFLVSIRASMRPTRSLAATDCRT